MTVEKKKDEGKPILVVDSHKAGFEALRAIFAATHRVALAANAEEALASLRAEGADMVIVDITAAEVCGFELIKAMKVERLFIEIPILVTSAPGAAAPPAEKTPTEKSAEESAFALGADDCLPQPYNPVIVRRRVENLIERYNAKEVRRLFTEQKKAESLLDMLGIAYWEWSKRSGYYHSKEYEKYAVSEMDNEKIWDPEAPFQYIHPDDVPLMRRFMQKYEGDEIKKSAVVRCRMRDGSYRWTEMFSYADVSPTGDLNRLVSAMHDVDKEWISSFAVEQKNRELSHIIDSTAGGVVTYLLGEKLTLSSCTTRINTKLGYSDEELARITTYNAYDYIYPTDVPFVKRKLEETSQTQSSTLIAYRIRKKDGSYKWFRASFFPDGEQDGRPKIYAVLTDIQEANADYTDALNQTNEMIVVADWESREILYLNEAAAKINGSTIAELTGQKCSQIARHSDEPCPYCFKKELTYDELTVRSLAVGKNYYQTKGKRMIWNGREAFVEYVSDVTAQHNMTERAVFERNLLTAATRVLFPMCILSNLTQNTYNIIEYETFNTKKAAPGGCFDELIEVGASTIPEQGRAVFVKAFSRENLLAAHAAGVKMVPLVHQQIGDDGKVHWNRTVVVFADQLFGGDLYTITFTDSMDELKNAEQSLKTALAAAEQANRAKTAFLSRVSHDMRTPLNGILGLTTILKDRIMDESVTRDLADLELSGKYLLNLINDTLDVSRIENGKLALNPAVCDSRSLFNNVLSLVNINAAAKNIRIHVADDGLQFPLLYLDTARLEQIVMNVVGNAIKFTPENGRVDITIMNLSADENAVVDRIIVRDYGVGMSKDFLPHIFEAFSQADQSRTNAYQGTGLGMTITKQLVKLMDGTIEVESELGKGTCFTIDLKFPVASETQVDAWKKTRISIDDGVGLDGKRILLCEDHPLNTKIATKLLEAKGMAVEHAENGAVGVELFQNAAPGHFDAILMDIRMPVMDGIDAAKAIRKMPREDAQTIPIIAMTANAFADDILQTQSAGMNAHLSKPVQTDLLYSTLASVLKVERDLKKQIILIVDDIELNRAVIRANLEDEYELLEAENGKQALEIIQNTKGINAVITDIQMPEMGGLELIRQIRSNNEYRHIVIIANTQFGDPQQEEELLALGANDFVYKPTTPKIVEIRVRNALKRM